MKHNDRRKMQIVKSLSPLENDGGDAIDDEITMPVHDAQNCDHQLQSRVFKF